MPDHVHPDPDQFARMMAEGPKGPLHMLNLIRLNNVARYEDGRHATGQEAFAEYSRLVAPLVERHGGRVIWAGTPDAVLIGPEDAHWDVGLIVEYPDMAAFQAMVTAPEYREVAIHRAAAVETSRLIRFKTGPVPQAD